MRYLLAFSIGLIVGFFANHMYHGKNEYSEFIKDRVNNLKVLTHIEKNLKDGNSEEVIRVLRHEILMQLAILTDKDALKSLDKKDIDFVNSVNERQENSTK